MSLPSTFPLPASSQLSPSPIPPLTSIPSIGFGTYRLPSPRDAPLTPLLQTAIDTGYTHIDTAQVYRNQTKIAHALRDIPNYQRSQICITTKLGMTHLGPKTRDAIETCLKELQVEYIDLFLIHWPGAAKLPPHSIKHKELRRESYETLQQAQRDGLIRAWGISNFQLHHLHELDDIGLPGPAVHQMEIHPLYFETTAKIRKWCTDRGIHLQAYSSFGGGELQQRADFMLEMADIGGRDPYETLLLWALAHGFSILPRTSLLGAGFADRWARKQIRGEEDMLGFGRGVIVDSTGRSLLAKEKGEALVARSNGLGERI